MADPPELHDWKPLVEDLHARQERAHAMGGEGRVERQRSLGQLPVRARLELLCDPGSFVEYALLADSMDPGLADKGYLASDGMVAGVGEIEGRRVCVCAYDFTVMGGSMGAVGERKTARMHELDLRRRRRAVPGAGDDERRGAPGGGDAGSLRGGHGLHPRAGGLRPHGEGDL